MPKTFELSQYIGENLEKIEEKRNELNRPIERIRGKNGEFEFKWEFESPLVWRLIYCKHTNLIIAHYHVVANAFVVDDKDYLSDILAIAEALEKCRSQKMNPRGK